MTDRLAALGVDLADLDLAIADSADAAQVERLQRIRRARMAELMALRNANPGKRRAD